MLAIQSNKRENIDMSINQNKQRGAVSLFVVVFAALLITIITVSFVRIMISDQQQASTTDLSQSAYDSAQAGVEDAKRALLRYQRVCDPGGDPTACNSAKTQISSSTCNDSVKTLSDVTVSGDEIKIETGGSNSLDQAYTCVKINLDTLDYLGSLSANESKFIPLQAVSGSSFDTVQLEWFNSDDLADGSNFNVNLQSSGSTSWPLLLQNSWNPNRPSIMRTQLMQFSSNGFNLGDFDKQNATSQSNANTLFLYPAGVTGTANTNVTATGTPGPDIRAMNNRDIRTVPKTAKVPASTALPITCSGNLTTGGYACSAKLQLPVPINGGDRTSFMYLGSLYNKTNYRVTLLDSTKPCDQATGVGAGCVKFNAVQPEVDSTGRTNDLFRRVQTRIELTDVNFPYPSSEVEITGNLCKDFRVTDNIADYQNNCTP